MPFEFRTFKSVHVEAYLASSQSPFIDCYLYKPNSFEVGIKIRDPTLEGQLMRFASVEVKVQKKPYHWKKFGVSLPQSIEIALTGTPQSLQQLNLVVGLAIQKELEAQRLSKYSHLQKWIEKPLTALFLIAKKKGKSFGLESAVIKVQRVGDQRLPIYFISHCKEGSKYETQMDQDSLKDDISFPKFIDDLAHH